MNKREKCTENEHSILYAETGGCCPLCTLPIMYKKTGSKKPTKGYELAHIYPLNPTPYQAACLASFPVPTEINALENLIALCPSCHSRYDKDFKVGEFQRLRIIKDGFLNDAKAKVIASKHAIQEEVCLLLDEIASNPSAGIEVSEISFDITTVDKKLKTGISPLQKREIRTNAIDFYISIRDHIKLLEQNDQFAVKILQNQINSYYMAMNKLYPDNKDLVFNYIAQWISSKTSRSLLSAKILTSFFVQNCEVFDVIP